MVGYCAFFECDCYCLFFGVDGVYEYADVFWCDVFVCEQMFYFGGDGLCLCVVGRAVLECQFVVFGCVECFLELVFDWCHDCFGGGDQL